MVAGASGKQNDGEAQGPEEVLGWDHSRAGCLWASVPGSAAKAFMSPLEGAPGPPPWEPRGPQENGRLHAQSSLSLSTRSLADGPAVRTVLVPEGPLKGKGRAPLHCVPHGRHSRVSTSSGRVGDWRTLGRQHTEPSTLASWDGLPSTCRPVGLLPRLRCLGAPSGSYITLWRWPDSFCLPNWTMNIPEAGGTGAQIFLIVV